MIGFGFGAARASKKNGFDPATLSLTGWWRASYGGSPWAPTASAGSSGSNGNLAHATTAPAVGAAVNGLTPADFDGTNDRLAGAAVNTFLANAAGGVAVLFWADTAAAPAAEAYDDRCLVTDANGRTALTHTTSGVRSTIYNGASWPETTSIACATGAWRWAFSWWDATNVYCALDGGTEQSIAIGGTGANISTGALTVGMNYASVAFIDGRMLDIMTIQAAWTTQNRTDIVSYGNTRYGLSL